MSTTPLIIALAFSTADTVRAITCTFSNERRTIPALATAHPVRSSSSLLPLVFFNLMSLIRDLSKNWNIDLATELEEYMDKLETLNISFTPEDGAHITSKNEGGNVMNFAEAALLIQGTSVIYSRKVEYLHALVYQTLAHLSNQQDARQPSHLNGEMGTNQDEEEVEESVFSHPLPLYDNLEEAKPSHITLKRSTHDDESGNTRRTQKEAQALSRSKNNIQASIALMGSLVPDEREHGETFKLLSCNLHASGVLLLDEASKKYLHPMQQAAVDQSLAFSETPGRQRGMWTNAEGDLPVTVLNFDEGDATDIDNEPDISFDHHPEDEVNAPVDEIPTETGLQTDPTETRRPVTGKVLEKDPWQPLDAYDASMSIVRPFRKGRSYPRIRAKRKSSSALGNKTRLVGLDDENEQDGLSDPAFRDRFFNHSKMPQWASWVWTETSNDNPLEKMCKRTFCKKLLLVKTCVALWQREAKWRSLMRRVEAREKQSAHAMLLREQAMEEEERDGCDPLSLSTATARLDLAFQRDETTGNNDDVANQDELSDNDDDMGFEDGGEGADWEQGNETGEHLGPIVPEMLSYEDICRQHLATFMAGTEKYVRETDLSKKVTEWQEKLTPLLKQQDTRPPFDIHRYGREIICRLDEKQRKVKECKKKRKKKRTREDEKDAVAFETLVEGKRPFEVCRLFLASLQLANSGNVALAHAHTAAEHDQVPFEMQLLSTVNAYEALQV